MTDFYLSQRVRFRGDLSRKRPADLPRIDGGPFTATQIGLSPVIAGRFWRLMVPPFRGSKLMRCHAHEDTIETAE